MGKEAAGLAGAQKEVGVMCSGKMRTGDGRNVEVPGNLSGHHTGPVGIFIPENTPAFEQIHCRAGLAPEHWRAPLAGQGP